MRLIDAEALGYEVLEEYGADGGSNDVNVIYGMIINAPTVDAVEVVKDMLRGEMKLKPLEVDAPTIDTSEGCRGCKHWIYRNNFGEDCEFGDLENCKYEPQTERRKKIGDEVYIHGYIDEIRPGTIIIRNDGGYFGTVSKEITAADSPLVSANKIVESLESMERDMRTFGDCEKANGVSSAIWLIEEMINRERI